MDTITVRVVAVTALGALAVTPVPLKVTTEAAVKCVKLPVIATGRLLCPCCPLFGFTIVSTGVPFVTVNPFASVTTSPPVVSVTLCAPAVAVDAIFNTAVAVVAEFTVKDAIVIPVPKLAVVVPCTKCVSCPVTATDNPCCPCCPLLGFTVVSTGVPFATMNPFASVTISAPVVSVTLCAPAVAVDAIFNTAVAVVAEFTVSEGTVIPVPKFAVVVPCTKCVNCPITATDNPCCPCCPLFGFTVVSTGVPETLKPFGKTANSEPVATCTSRVPLAAVDDTTT
jgi:hypothetical protein